MRVSHKIQSLLIMQQNHCILFATLFLAYIKVPAWNKSLKYLWDKLSYGYMLIFFNYSIVVHTKSEK